MLQENAWRIRATRRTQYRAVHVRLVENLAVYDQGLGIVPMPFRNPLPQDAHDMVDSSDMCWAIYSLNMRKRCPIGVVRSATEYLVLKERCVFVSRDRTVGLDIAKAMKYTGYALLYRKMLCDCSWSGGVDQ